MKIIWFFDKGNENVISFGKQKNENDIKKNTFSNMFSKTILGNIP